MSRYFQKHRRLLPLRRSCATEVVVFVQFPGIIFCQMCCIPAAAVLSIKKPPEWWRARPTSVDTDLTLRSAGPVTRLHRAGRWGAKLYKPLLGFWVKKKKIYRLSSTCVVWEWVFRIVSYWLAWRYLCLQKEKNKRRKNYLFIEGLIHSPLRQPHRSPRCFRIETESKEKERRKQ